MQLWDTAGQEKYRALVRIYYRGSAGAIVTFSQDDKVCGDIRQSAGLASCSSSERGRLWQDTFEYAKSWVNALREEDSTMVIVLAANKSDLHDPRAFMKVS